MCALFFYSISYHCIRLKSHIYYCFHMQLVATPLGFTRQHAPPMYQQVAGCVPRGGPDVCQPFRANAKYGLPPSFVIRKFLISVAQDTSYSRSDSLVLSDSMPYDADFLLFVSRLGIDVCSDVMLTATFWLVMNREAFRCHCTFQ